MPLPQADRADLPLPRPGLLSRRPPDPRASIVLVGGPKTGKSTLAVIASVSLRRRAVEFDLYFVQKTGLRRRDVARKAGQEDSTAREFAVLRSLLLEHALDAVIVCPLDCLSAPNQLLLKAFSETHPVILVLANLIFPDWKLDGTKSPRLDHDEDSAAGRLCSNYEYHNSLETITRPDGEDPITDPVISQAFPTLTLKPVEQDFLGFIDSIFRLPRRNALNGLDFNFPLILRSSFTYALSLTRKQMLGMQNLEGVLQDGADVVELRIDAKDTVWTEPYAEAFQSISRFVTLARRNFSGPVIYHVERHSTDDTAHDDARYYAFLLYGLRLLVDYITVDLGSEDEVIRDIVGARATTDVIGHFHFEPPYANGGWKDPDRLRYHDRARRLGCQIVRLTQAAESQVDNFVVLQFAAKVRKPQSSSGMFTIAYNTGPIGQVSRSLNEIFTPICPTRQSSSQLRHEVDDADEASGDISLRDAQSSLYSTFLQDRCRLYIIGSDVSKSLSPAVYRDPMCHLGIPHEFLVRSMSSISALEELISDDYFGGASIAQGHKVSVLPYVSFMSPHATAIGAVNTLIPIRCEWGETNAPPLEFWRRRNCAGPIKGLYGDNTDWIGMYRCIAKRLSPINAVTSRTTGLVIGAGGTARAAVYAMIQLGVRKIFIYNRTVAKAVTLANDFHGVDITHHSAYSGIHAGPRLPIGRPRSKHPVEVRVLKTLDEPWPEGYAQPTMAIYCIRAPPHAKAQVPDFTIPAGWLKSPHGGVVVDTGYDPLISPLILQMHQEAARGWVTVDGFHILPEQAAAQFELITGRKAPYLRMSIEMLRHYSLETDPRTRALIESRLEELNARVHSIS